VLELLLARGSRLDAPAVLLPTGDAFVQFLSRYERELRRWFLFALPEPPAREALVDKRLQYELAAQVGTPCPRTWPLRQWDDLARIAREVEYPAVLKPCAAHLWRSVFRNKGFLVDGPAELERRCAEIAPHGLEMLVQSFVPGPPTNLYLLHAYIDDGDRPLAVWTKRKLRQYPVELGTGTLSESVRCEEVEQLGLELLRRVRYRGIGYVEFKRDERDGRFKLIELNGRLPQSNIHAARCGVNFPLIAYLDLTGQKPEPQMEYRLGVRYLNAVNDFQAFWTLYGRGELGPVEWLRSIAGARVFAHFDWRDPLPFLAANQYGLLFARLPQYVWLYRHGRSTVSGSER
jgi:predicted ATP-grasp superfamily ATP-dependent carboligase